MTMKKILQENNNFLIHKDNVILNIKTKVHHLWTLIAKILITRWAHKPYLLLHKHLFYFTIAKIRFLMNTEETIFFIPNTHRNL